MINIQLIITAMKRDTSHRTVGQNHKKLEKTKKINFKNIKQYIRGHTKSWLTIKNLSKHFLNTFILTFKVNCTF